MGNLVGAICFGVDWAGSGISEWLGMLGNNLDFEGMFLKFVDVSETLLCKLLESGLPCDGAAGVRFTIT